MSSLVWHLDGVKYQLHLNETLTCHWVNTTIIIWNRNLWHLVRFCFMLAHGKRSAGVAPDMNLRNLLHKEDEARKWGDPPRPWIPGQMSSKVQKRRISSPTKISSKLFSKKKRILIFPFSIFLFLSLSNTLIMLEMLETPSIAMSYSSFTQCKIVSNIPLPKCHENILVV